MTIFEGVSIRFRADRILFEDDDVIAVHKEAGVSVARGDASRSDDLVGELRLFLSQRDGIAKDVVYFGIHEHLDRDCSGVVVFAKRKSANARLAEQFESRTVRSRFDVLIDEDPGRDSMLVIGERLDVHVAATTRGGIARLSIESTSRWRDVLRDLEANGVKVIGESVPAPRMMVHRQAIALRHPATDRPCTIEDPHDAPLRWWMRDGFADREMVNEIVAAAFARRGGMGSHAETPTGFRLAHGAADYLPGVWIDVYESYAVLQAEDALPVVMPVVDALEKLGIQGVYFVRRPADASRVTGMVSEWAPPDPIRGTAAPDDLAIDEYGIFYPVRLGDGFSTGIFFDQRENRRRIAEEANGKSVLNLFSHDGAFTIAAARGGAVRTLSIDASRGATQRAAAAVSGNTVSPQHRFWQRDVFEALEFLATAGEAFDIVVVDPPTYSTTRRSRWRSGKDWRSLFTAVFAVVAPRGLVLATTHDRSMGEKTFERHVRGAAAEARVSIDSVELSPPPFDFPILLGGTSHLKTMWVRIG